jgi:uncharacterized protein YfcZ (UPF0381/DUF406 family)
VAFLQLMNAAACCSVKVGLLVSEDDCSGLLEITLDIPITFSGIFVSMYVL